MNTLNSQLISHGKNTPLIEHQQRLQACATLSIPRSEALNLLEQLDDFELGRFLLTHGGLNGYWTSFIILQGLNKKAKPPLEKWILEKAPVIKATRERFAIFQQQLKKYTQEGMVLASLPCGLMDDLLRLETDHFKNIQLVGIDLDPESLRLAQYNAKTHGKEKISTFIKRDAWQLGIKESYDILTSNGLTLYEQDDGKIIDFYGQIFDALKPQGIMITSFLTPPPQLFAQSPWKNVNPEDLSKQKIIFSEVLNVAWQVFRSEALTRQLLETVGFKILDVIYDKQAMFPTIVVQK